MLYEDGSQTDFSRSTSTTMDWTSWETNSNTSFVEATYAFAPILIRALHLIRSG